MAGSRRQSRAQYGPPRSADERADAVGGFAGPGAGAAPGPWAGWSPRGALERGPLQDRVDRGPPSVPTDVERVDIDYIDALDPDFGGRDSEAYYARVGRNQDRMQARREQQARRGVPDRDRGGEEIDHDYHLRQGPHEVGQHYVGSYRHGASRWSGEQGSSAGGFVEPSYGSSPTRERIDHRGRGPRNYQRSDERIVEDLHRRLTEDPFIDASDVRVACQDGRVTLDGEVETRRMKLRAEDVVDACPGVGEIDNRLRVRQRPVPRIGHWP